MTKQLMVDPTNDNYALDLTSAETLVSVRALPNIPGRDYSVDPPTLAEFKAAPILGYSRPRACTHTEES